MTIRNALGRLTGATAGGQTQSFVYDACTHGAGRLCSATDAQGSLSNTYTPEGGLASQISTIAGTAYTTRYAYDALGRPTAITYPNGVVANTTYANGKPATMTATVNGATGNVVTGLTYEPFGGASGWTYGNGLVRGNDFDLDGRLTGIGTTTPSNATVIQSLTYGFDANDSITAITNGVNAALSQSFGYDALTRLTSVSSASGNATWTFDGNGNRNRMNQTTASSSVAYAIASASNRMVGANARSFGFDALSNITSDSGNAIAYHFDPFNRMDSSTVAGATTTYHVDPLGRRTSKATVGGSWTNFVYAPDGTLLAETGPAGATDYLWLGGSLVGMVRNGAIYAIQTDHLGRPELVTDPNRNIVWRAANFAFDRTVTQDNVGGLNVGFPGQYYDTETGLWNNGFRDYDATLGRYVESDPLGLAAGVNTYAYVGGNPLMGVDPYGLCNCKGDSDDPNAPVDYKTGNGVQFKAPERANWWAVHEAGYASGGLLNIIGIRDAIGQGGMYDFQRGGGHKNSEYVNASNYAVGVFMQGAGVSESMTVFVGTTYAEMFSKNAGSPAQSQWWKYGWSDAKNNALAQPACK